MRSPTRPSPFRSPSDLDPVATAPLLCAGLIGWRSLKAAGDGETIGLYGFGAAAHIIAQVCRWQGRRVFAFTRPGDAAGQAFARSMGAEWAGGSDETPPAPLDAAILFAPVGRARSGRAGLGAQGRPGRLRRHPHERHPVVPVSAPVGGAAASSRSPISPGPTARSFWRSRPASPCGRRRPSTRSTRPTKRSTICARAGSRARQCSSPEVLATAGAL